MLLDAVAVHGGYEDSGCENVGRVIFSHHSSCAASMCKPVAMFGFELEVTPRG